MVTTGTYLMYKRSLYKGHKDKPYIVLVIYMHGVYDVYGDGQLS